MTRDYFQDITPNNGSDNSVQPRSIRNVTTSTTRARAGRPTMMPNTDTSKRNYSSGNRPNFILWGVAILALLALGFIVSTLFLKTTVTIVPRQHTVVFDSETIYTAFPIDDSDILSGALAYATNTRTFEESTSVEASGTETVSLGASGTITIYNAYSKGTQRLIKNTRFETPSGNVYRIRDSVVIPGKVGSTPGSLTAVVYADQPGESYNIGPVDRFSVPGLKNSPEMYAKIYAKSTESMTGGYEGTRPSISESAKIAAEAHLEASLKTKIANEYSDTTASYALIDLAKISYSSLSTEVSDGGNAMASKTATVVMPVISRTGFDSFLASETNALAGSTAVRIEDPSTFSFVSSGNGASSLGLDSIDFSIGGKAVFVWDVDTVALAKDLANKNKGAFQAIVSGHPSVDTASAKVYPLWGQTFPSDYQSINIELSSDKMSR